MKQILAAFPRGLISDALTLYDWVVKHNKTMEDVREYLTKKEPIHGISERQKAELEKKQKRILVICPECGKLSYNLRSICTPKGKANIHGYKSAWYCEECGYEKFSLVSVAQELKLYQGGKT